jgi:hypothetical protein
MADACARPVAALDGIFPGSWIDANFYIWIGHQDDQRGWSQLADARIAVDLPSPVDAATRGRAREELLIAEGSDWFWWYGDDHSSEHDPEFDDLFRRHLRNVYRLLDFPIPDELFLSNISAGAAPSVETEPCGLITPRIDGEESSYFEWLGAGSAEFREVAGAMHQAERRQPLVSRLRFGFDHDRVYLCLDGARPLHEALAEGQAVAISVMQPVPLRVLISADASAGVLARVQHRAHGSVEWMVRASETQVGAGRMLELSVPLQELAADRPSRLALFVTVHDRNGAEIERHPNAAPLELAVPDDWFEARNWSA